MSSVRTLPTKVRGSHQYLTARKKLWPLAAGMENDPSASRAIVNGTQFSRSVEASIVNSSKALPSRSLIVSPSASIESRAPGSRKANPVKPVAGVISIKQISLFLAPEPLVMVNRPSLTVMSRVPEIHRVELVGVPETVRSPSALMRYVLLKLDGSPATM